MEFLSRVNNSPEIGFCELSDSFDAHCTATKKSSDRTRSHLVVEHDAIHKNANKTGTARMMIRFEICRETKIRAQ